MLSLLPCFSFRQSCTKPIKILRKEEDGLVIVEYARSIDVADEWLYKQTEACIIHSELNDGKCQLNKVLRRDHQGK